MKRVLILEDEAVLRSAMVRGVAKMPGIAVVEAATVGAALALIDAQAPAMIVSDIDLPDRSGLELLGELGRRGLRVPILFVSAYLKAYAAQIPRHAGVEVREKPLRLDELRAILSARLEAAPAEEEAAPFAPADYLQLACLGHRSVLIEVDTAGEKGLIVVVDGSLWTASDHQGAGEDAFRRLVFRQGAQVRVRALRDDPGPRTIESNWEQLLMNAARELDESSRSPSELAASDLLDLGDDPPPPPAPRPTAPTLPSATLPPAREAVLPPAPEPPPDPLALAFDAAFEVGVEALLVKDYAAAYAAFERAGAVRPDDPKVVTNLERLRQLGHGPGPQ